MLSAQTLLVALLLLPPLARAKVLQGLKLEDLDPSIRVVDMKPGGTINVGARGRGGGGKPEEESSQPCADDASWRDRDGAGCMAYRATNCGAYAERFASASGSANSACCVCKGGQRGAAEYVEPDDEEQEHEHEL